MHRKEWTKHVEYDPTVKTWFLGLPLEEQLAYLNDPDRRQKAFPRV